MEASPPLTANDYNLIYVYVKQGLYDVLSVVIRLNSCVVTFVTLNFVVKVL